MVNLSFGLPFGDKKKVANTAVNSILQLETQIRLDPSLFTQLQPRGRRNSTREVAVYWGKTQYLMDTL